MGHLHQMKTALRKENSGEILEGYSEESIGIQALQDLKKIETALDLIKFYEKKGVVFDFLNTYTTKDKDYDVLAKENKKKNFTIKDNETFNLKKDELIMVSDNKNVWDKRFFSHIEIGECYDKFYCYKFGMEPTSWDYWKPIERV
jgi:homospermidine synthase